MVNDLSLRDNSGDDGTGAVVTDLALTIAEGVEFQNGVTVATTDWPWLQLGSDARRVAGRWVRLTYIAGLAEPLARPVLRCFVGGVGYDEVMPGALFGRAIWLGRIPDGATAIRISPTNQLGRFAFAIERLELVPRAQLLWDVFRRNPSRAWVCLWARMTGMRHLARLQVKRTLCATPLRQYDSWRKLRTRPFDPRGFDSSASSAARRPHIRILTQFDAQATANLPLLLTQLSSQPYPDWSLALTASPADAANLDWPAEAKERLLFVAPGSSADSALDGLEDDDFIVQHSAGDLLPDYALAALAQAACDHPEVDVLYGDEDFIDERGKRASPCLRPSSSATLSSSADTTGAPCAIKVGKLRANTAALEGLVRFALIQTWLDALGREQCAMRHVRRVLRTRPCPRPLSLPPSTDTSQTPTQDGGASLRASIIVATRDRLDLLKRCVEGLQTRTRLTDVEILVVDNGSVRPETKAYLADLTQDQRFRVLSMPGPFNFSRLCNQAAAQARAPILVFLNNDTEIIHEEWLDELLAPAAKPDIGAVGAKLFYPNGRVQHAGVVVGIDGRAGHFERGLDGAAAGYFGRLNAPHEVSAVTAACLAVEARKFFAIGGFDEINLPVELNDVDLCLRLRERGWRTLCTPAARLIHHESASRGASVRPDERYGEQHDYFRARWIDVIRDDPHFHPALSLDSLQATLG